MRNTSKRILVAIVMLLMACMLLPGALAADVGPEATGTWNTDKSIGVVNELPLYGDALHFKVQISAEDVSMYQYRLTRAAGTATPWTAVENGRDVEFVSEDGKYTLQIRLLSEKGKAVWVKSCGEAILEKTGMEKSAPTVKLTAGNRAYNGAWTNSDVTVQVSGSSAVSGIKGYEYAIDYTDPSLTDTDWAECPGKLTVSTDTNATYRFRAVTNAGNVSAVVEKDIRVQKTAPKAAAVVSAQKPGDSGWYTELPIYTVEMPTVSPYSAPIHCRLTVSVNSKIQFNGEYSETTAPAINGDGKWIIKAVVTDDAGNRAEGEGSTLSLQVDTTAPSVAKILGDGRIDLGTVSSQLLTKNTLVTALAEDNASGVKAIYYRIGNEEWKEYPVDGIHLTSDGTVVYQFKVVDNAGNEDTAFSCPVMLDTTSADAEVHFLETNQGAGGIYNGNITAAYTIHDAGSGIRTVTYRVLSGGKPTQAGVLYQGKDADCSGTVEILAAKNNGAAITLELTILDAAGNKRVYTSSPCVNDTTAPVVEGYYSGSVSVGAYLSMEGFRGSRTLVVKVTEPHFDEKNSSIVVREEDSGKILPYTWLHEGNVHTAVIECNEDGHYTVSASICDTVGNKTQRITYAAATKGANAFVIDTTAPVFSLSYDNNQAVNEFYYPAERTVTLAVRERNFAQAGIQGTVTLTTPDGKTQTWKFADWKENKQTHTYTSSIKLPQDGTYQINVAGRDVYGTSGKNVTDAFCIDTTTPEPFFDFVDSGMAYGGELKPLLRIMDWNIDSITLKVYRTRKDKIMEDVTEKFAAVLDYEDIEGGRQALLDVFGKEEANDGIYTLSVSTVDKAGNAAEKEVTFSVNRFGSLYVYDNFLQSIQEGYFQKIGMNIVITEYNPSGLVAESPLVAIYRNGSLMNNIKYTVTPDPQGGEKVGLSGWYEYKYVIDAENFTADGFYGIVVSSADRAGNTPENTDKEAEIRFAKDASAPELVSVSGLTQNILNADKVRIGIQLMDTVELKEVSIYLNGELVEQALDVHGYEWEGEIEATEGMDQHLRIVAVDTAGNRFDSDEASGTGYCADFTVSTNFFIRFYANKTLFYSVIGGTLGLIALLGVVIVVLRKKKTA